MKQSIAAALATLQRGDARGALAMLLAAERSDPKDLGVKLHLALAQRTLGDFPAALRALDAALAIDPYFFLALLSKGVVLEHHGPDEVRSADLSERAQDRARVPRTPLPRSKRRSAMRGRWSPRSERRWRSTCASRSRSCEPGTRASRSSASTSASTSTPERSAPITQSRCSCMCLVCRPFHFSAAICFRGCRGWKPRRTSIRAELAALLEAGMPGFAPYVAYAPGTPVNQWSELNHSTVVELAMAVA